MIAAEEERLVHILARLIQLQVPNCRVKLFVLDDERLGIAQIPEDVVVEVETALINTRLSLTLTAHAKDRSEICKLLHPLFLFLLF